LTWQNPETLKVEPWIAQSWTTNADKTEYTFKLHPGVTFSDGTPLDANAVAKNFDTYGLGNKALRLPVSEVINNYDHSEVVDPLTVKFYFKKSSPGFRTGVTQHPGAQLRSAGRCPPYHRLRPVCGQR
jgi:peptide/nickel transport system substrate-binding protein